MAIGSSTTAGEGNITVYPERLHSLLQADYPNATITAPDLVIWQVGTNAV